MADVNKLREDIKWWTEELRIRQEKVKEAIDTLKLRQEDLMRAEQEEAKNI